jgi:hypothetical protein
LSLAIRRARFGIVAPLVVLSAFAAAGADPLEAVWLGGEGNWSAGLNWDTGAAPNNDATNTYIVRIDNANAAASIVTLNVGATIDGLFLDADDQLQFANGQDLALDATGGGMVLNEGTIFLQSSGSFTDLEADGGTITLSGGGQVLMTNSTANRLIGANGGSWFNMDNTILGAGQIGAGITDITNSGTIIANGTALMTIDPTANPFVNDGILRADAGATMRIVSGSIDNLGGLIEALQDSTVELSNVTIAAGTLSTTGTGVIVVDGGAALDGVVSTITQGAVLQQPNADDLTLRGTIENTNEVHVGSTGGFTDLIFDAGAVILTGGGSIILSNQVNNRLFGTNGGSMNNVNNTISGAGQLGLAQLAMTNGGVIIANQPTPLQIRPNVGGMANTGTLRADAGATLQLQSATFNNAGGTIEALDASLVELTNATVAGGTLDTAGSGVLRALNLNTLDGSGGALINAGALDLANNADVTLLGTIDNQGTITINSTGSFTDLEPTAGVVTLSGGGEIVMTNLSTNRILGVSGGSLINVDNTIRGAGNVGFNTLPMTNQGTILADLTVALTIDPDGVTGLENQGVLHASGTGGMNIAAGPFTTSGTVIVDANSQLTRTGDYVQTAGSTIVDGTLSASGIVEIQGGILGGSGTVASSVTNDATTAPGASAGELEITGVFTQTANGAVAIEIGGLTPGSEFDRLVIGGAANLDGTLSVEIINGFPPTVGQTFEVMTFASRTGTFASLNLASPPGAALQANIEATRVVIEVIPGASLPGDMNCDSSLTVADVAPFALALIDPAEYEVQFPPPCDINNADMDGNMAVNAIDVRLFIEALLP